MSQNLKNKPNTSNKPYAELKKTQAEAKIISHQYSSTRTYMPRFDDSQLGDPWASSLTQEISVDILQPKRQNQYASLRQVKGPKPYQIFDIKAEEHILGRSPEVDFSIDLAELSREHAIITNDDGEYRITDLNSKNGMYLNGLKIHSTVLRNGDLLQFASSCFVFDGAF